MTYRILITGTRETLTTEQEETVWRTLDEACSIVPLGDRITMVHGDCPTGVDAYVEQDGHSYFVGAVTEGHPADWYTHDENCYHAPRPGGKCPAAGPRRNAKMVSLGADICLAFPMGDSKGTRGCIKLAQDAGIPTVITEL